MLKKIFQCLPLYIRPRGNDHDINSEALNPIESKEPACKATQTNDSTKPNWVMLKSQTPIIRTRRPPQTEGDLITFDSD